MINGIDSESIKTEKGRLLMVLKVGDKVRVKELDTAENTELLGKELTIRKIVGESSGGNCHFYGYSDSLSNVILGDYLEKVVEQEYQIGDKVRILDVDAIACGWKYWKNGDVTEVVSISSNGNPYLRTRDAVQVVLVITPDELHAIERIDDDKKPSKKQRIEALEREVAALKAEMEALRGAKKPKTANQLRAEVIADAKSFVKKHTDKKGRAYLSVPDSRPGGIEWGVSKIKFEVNAEKRTVVALAIGMDSGRVREKAIAKCAPDDVFNADIGKAIAVGRLFGLDVERFVNAPKPTEVVVGQRVNTKFGGRNVEVRRITSDGILTEYYMGTRPDGLTWSSAYHANIIDDTEAQYEQ